MVGLVSCKNEEDPSQNEGTRVVTTFLSLSVCGNFSRCSRAANSVVPGRILLNFKPFKILWLSWLPVRMQKIQIKMKGLECSQDFLYYNQLPWKSEFWSTLAQNLMQYFPHPNDAPEKIWFWSACWSQRYQCLKVWTDARTAAWVPSYQLTGSLWLRWPIRLRRYARELTSMKCIIHSFWIQFPFIYNNVVLVTCKNEEDPIYRSWDLDAIQTYNCPSYLQEWKRSIQNWKSPDLPL